MALERTLLDKVADLVARVESARGLSTARHEQLLDPLELIGEVRRLVDALGAEFAGEIDARSGPAIEDSLARRLGEKSAAALIARVAGIPPTEARDWCIVGSVASTRLNLQGEVLPQTYPAIVQALESAAIGVEALSRIVETLDAVAKFLSGDEVHELELLLVGVAPGLSDREVGALCRQVIDRANPDGVEPREEELRAKAGVRVIHLRDGMTRWILTLHPEAAGFLKAAVDARTSPRRVPTFTDSEHTPTIDDVSTDDRTLEQRQVDAIQSIARESLAHDHGQLAGTAVTMNVTMTLESLKSGIGTAQIDGVDEPISAATARRLAVDAEFVPIVLGAPSEPLDVGRSERLFTMAQRRAMAIRDGGCLWPGCTAPPGWCEVAHIVAWVLFGPTDLANGILLCPFHHRRFDNDGWQFEWRDRIPYLIPPPWVDSTQTPRRAGRPAIAA